MSAVNNTQSSIDTSTGLPTADAAQKGLSGDYNQFLKLLTTQLTNQDPTAPLDTNQITSQLAQLSQVQATITTNTKLDQLISMYSASQVNTAVSYIGKQVDATGNQTQLSGGVAALVYDLPAGATSVTVTIKDSTGNTVFSGAAPANSGRNQVQWPGNNSITGNQQKDGAYTFSVDAKDANGKPVAVTTHTTGVVSAVNTQNGINSLMLGDLTIPVSSVQSIYNAGTNPGA